MTASTVTRTKHQQTLNQLWVFGYGSLIFRPDFPFIERQRAHILGWERRFWQGSHDHRGEPHAPGRVVTLVPVEGAVCEGMAYQVEPDVLAHLDYREKNGYARVNTTLYLEGEGQAQGLVYIATENNEAFLGPASDEDIATHILNSQGPSGTNAEYLLSLARALRALPAEDSHVFSLETLVAQKLAAR